MPLAADYLARPRALKPRYIIDPVAFFIALIGGPLLFTFCTFWLLFIPVFALGMGAAPYLVIGTPVLLYHLGRRPAKPRELASLALFSLLCATVPLAIAVLILGDEELLAGLFFVTLFGMVFAPAWAACFGWIYQKLCRDFYTHPVPA